MMNVYPRQQTGYTNRVSASFLMLAIFTLQHRRISQCLVLIGSLLFVGSGCKPQEQITKTTAPHEAAYEEIEPDPPETAKAGMRILALIAEGTPVKGEPQWWFFKLMGRPEAVGKRQEGLKQFAASLKIPNDNESMPKFDLPKGWKVGKSQKEFVLFVIRTGHSFTPNNIDVSMVGGTMAGNLDRWCDQLGIEHFKPEQIEEWSKQEPASVDPKAPLKPLATSGSRKVYWVDMSGPGGEKKMPPFFKQ